MNRKYIAVKNVLLNGTSYPLTDILILWTEINFFFSLSSHAKRFDYVRKSTIVERWLWSKHDIWNKKDNCSLFTLFLISRHQIVFSFVFLFWCFLFSRTPFIFLCHMKKTNGLSKIIVNTLYNVSNKIKSSLANKKIPSISYLLPYYLTIDS